MKIEFQLTKQDYIDFNLFHMEHSPVMKRSLLAQRFVPPILFLLMPLVLHRFSDASLWYWLFAFSLTSALWIVFYPKYFRQYTLKKIAAFVDEGKNSDMFGNHSLTFDDEGILDTTENGELKTQWSGVEKYSQSQDHFFIYISSVMAYIIPKRVFGSEELKDEFSKLLEDKIN